MKFYICLIFSLATVSGSQIVAAQENAAQPSIHFRILPWDTYLDDVFMYENGQYQPLEARPNLISHEYTYSGPSPMTLYRQVDTPDGSTVYQPLQRLPLSAGRNGYLLIMRRGMDTDKAEHAFLYPYDYDGHGDAAFVLFNFTSLPVKAQFGSVMIDLEPGEYRDLDTDDLPADNYSFRCKIAGKPDGKWRLVYNDFIHLNSRARILFFLSNSQLDGMKDTNLYMQTKKIVDYRLSEKARKGTLNVFDTKPTVGGY